MKMHIKHMLAHHTYKKDLCLKKIYINYFHTVFSQISHVFKIFTSKKVIVRSLPMRDIVTLRIHLRGDCLP